MMHTFFKKDTYYDFVKPFQPFFCSHKLGENELSKMLCAAFVAAFIVCDICIPFCRFTRSDPDLQGNKLPLLDLKS